jgi:hypothetical protein
MENSLTTSEPPRCFLSSLPDHFTQYMSHQVKGLVDLQSISIEGPIESQDVRDVNFQHLRRIQAISIGLRQNVCVVKGTRRVNLSVRTQLVSLRVGFYVLRYIPNSIYTKR